MGTGILETGLARTERVGLQIRTSDPTTTSEGEFWIRSDIAPDTDQLATLRGDTGGSTIDVPIYNTAATVDGVYKPWRLPVGGTFGFIPIVDGGAFPKVKYQHNGTVMDAHNALEVSAIPDSDLDHLWNAPNVSSIDPWADELGSEDMNQTGDPSLGENINGNNAVAYDGVDDYHNTDSALATGSNEEYTLVVVTDPLSLNDSGNPIVSNGLGSATDGYSIRKSSDSLELVHNGVNNFGDFGSNEVAVVVATFDGSTLIVDFNGTEEINTTGSAPNTPTTGASIAAYPDGDNPEDCEVGAVGHEASFANESRRDELTNEFADEFDITI